jgi:uncharacterized cupredoxin-like copper-binding protein
VLLGRWRNHRAIGHRRLIRPGCLGGRDPYRRRSHRRAEDRSGIETVPAGVPVTFVVTNSGATDHEFYLGDEAAQAEHEKEMVEMGGMAHDEPEGIAVKPGEIKELTYTFAEAGKTLAGCQVAGHYGGGMKAEITVE